ncbi:MAG: 3-deoxy-manno-octulosonate cytidylyltransferase [Pseudomonadota bacterium]
MSDFHVIIPARYDSQRLPGKVLATLADRALIAHVHDAAVAAGPLSVTVATDDERVAEVVKAFGGNAVLTGEHASGSDRIAEAARMLDLENDALIVNLQGDEPLMPPGAIRQVAECLAEADAAQVATLAVPIHEEAEFLDPNVVKVVLDRDGLALYFSRSPIPAVRDALLGEGSHLPADEALRHVGLYAYRNAFLQELTSTRPAPIEEFEKLEQLRVLHLGARIAVGRHPDPIPAGVDSPEDLRRVARALSDAGDPVRVLFVCMGNICRSPTGQGIAEKLIRERGLTGRILVDSAGTHAYHVGEPPDPRSSRAAARRGFDLTQQRARRVEPSDFHRFDHILAMDGRNLEALEAMAPADGSAVVCRVLDYSTLGIAHDVPDPYYGGAHGFEQVLDLLENAVAAFLDDVSKEQHVQGA